MREHGVRHLRDNGLLSCGGGTDPKNPESRKYEKLQKKSPTPGWAPKIRKKYRNFWGQFCSFWYFFVFLGPNLEWGIFYVFFFCSCNFFVFPGFRGFWALCHPRSIVRSTSQNIGNQLQCTKCASLQFVLQQCGPVGKKLEREFVRYVIESDSKVTRRALSSTSQRSGSFTL